jgi:hypothetical protein
MLPAPVLHKHEGFHVVRDDLLPGGTKRRAIHVLFDDQHYEYVYASPVYGYAQLALAYAARDHGHRATIFCAQRKQLHPLTSEAQDAGATVVQVPHGYLNVVKARAREYCEARPSAKLFPFGLDTPMFIEALAEVARGLNINPHEVWTVVGSGALTRALQMAWPDARFYGVQVGAEVKNAGKATVFKAPEKYEGPARVLPPFPSSVNYDAKIWRFVKQHASVGATIWNVGK